MAVFAVGDVQGCYDELRRLLDKAGFDPDKDKLWLAGDLVNRGPKSLKTLRYVYGLGNRARVVLGNHDLHLLALGLTGRSRTREADLLRIINASDGDELLDWLRHQPLAHYSKKRDTLMVHAGVIPRWSLQDVLDRAAEVEKALQGPKHSQFLANMYGSEPSKWNKRLKGMRRLRFITNCLTRMRYCRKNGSMDLTTKGSPGNAPKNRAPWFLLPDRVLTDTRIIFGHWSTLGYIEHDNVVGLDTGAVWGGKLTGVWVKKKSVKKVAVKSRHSRPVGS